MGNTPQSPDKKFWLYKIKNPKNVGLKTYRLVIALKTEKTKYCNKCKQYMPISEFEKDLNFAYGIKPYCSVCDSIKSTEIEIAEKECSKCHVIKPINDFTKKRYKYHIGYKTYCKQCRNKAYSKKLENDPEYKEKVRKAVKIYQKIYSQRDEIKQHKRDYFRKNKAHIYARLKKYYAENPDKWLAEKHRRRVNYFLKTGKDAPELLGCNKEFLIKWFKFHFTFDKELNMSNYGTVWHMDHVIPCAQFNMDLEEHKIICFNWKNLLPLKAKENTSKNCNIDLEQINEQNKRLKLFSEITGEKYPETPLNIILDSETH